MGGGGGHEGEHDIQGCHDSPPQAVAHGHRKGLCAVIWFWILYRAKQDGLVVLGWRHPWDGHGDHGHGHGHDEASH